MRTKKSKQRQRLDGLIQEGLALLICDITQKIRKEGREPDFDAVLRIERLSEVYRRVGD